MNLIIAIIAALLVYMIVAYNGMIKLKNRVKEAWADIDVQLKRRYNLIPNIVETVKGYASHEEGVLTQVTEARANAINATNVKDQGAAENMLAGALKSVFAVAENYPDLKANQNFLQLQGELVDTEDKIQSARRFYNSVTRDFNTKIQQVPAKFIANAFKFKVEEFFEIEEEEQRDNVEVSFNKEGTRQAEAPAEAAPVVETPVAEVAPESEAEEPKTEEAPAEPVVEEKPAEEPKVEETPAEPEAPAEPVVEATPAPEAAPEPTEEEKPAEPVVAASEPVAEEKKAEEPVTDEAPAEPAVEEPKVEEAVPETPAEPEVAPEPEAPAEPHEDQTAMPLGGETPTEEEGEKPAEEAPAEPTKEEDKPAA